MSDAAEKALLDEAAAGFQRARELAEVDPLKSLAVAVATAGAAVVAGLQNELDETTSP